MSAGERRRMSGFTFLEMMVALAVLSLIGLMVDRVLLHTHEGERYVEAIRRATENGQRAAQEVAETVSASRLLFHGDERGRAYLDALDLGARPLAPNARLPVILEQGRLEQDAEGVPATGNVLLFAEESDPVACVADADAGHVRYIDTYRLVCVYPSRTDRRLVHTRGLAIDLVAWRSAPFPSRTQVLAIEDADERQSVLVDLYHRFGHDLVWDPGQPVDAAFYAIDALGGAASGPSAGLWIEEDPDHSAGGRLVHADVQLAESDDGMRLCRPVFVTDEWAPNGFEVKVVGASGSRKVWMHLVVESPASPGRSAVQSNTLIVSVRDG